MTPAAAEGHPLQRLAQLGLVLPAPPPPIANFVTHGGGTLLSGQ